MGAQVLFVCSGNTCRSPMAAALLRHLLKEHCLDLAVTSAGVAALEQAAASEHAQEVMRRRGLDLSSHRARAVTAEMVRSATLILTMTAEHKACLLHLYPQAREKVFTLKEFAGEEGEVEDPVGGGLEEYERCAAELEKLLRKITPKLQGWCEGERNEEDSASGDRVGSRRLQAEE